MKIVHVLDTYDQSTNGVATATKSNVREQKKLGHDVLVLATGKPSEGKIAFDEFKLPLFQYLVDQQGFAFAKPDKMTFYEAFRGADIVHFHLPSPFCVEGVKIAKQMGVPIVSSFHLLPQNITYTIGLGKFKWLNNAIFKAFYKRFYRYFDAIHCPSEMTAQQLRKHNYDANLTVISNGVSDNFRPIKSLQEERAAETDGIFRILSVGRLSREKRHDLLIQAAKESRHCDKIQLFFAGQGPEKEHLEKLAASLPNPANFHFYSQEELIRRMNQVDLYVHSADAEIEGVSCIEAMACGLVPVISKAELSATNRFALCEASLFEAGNATDLARKIDYWIEHPEEHALYKKKYAEEGDAMRVSNTSRRLVNLYEEVREAYYEKAYAATPGEFDAIFEKAQKRTERSNRRFDKKPSIFSRALKSATAFLVYLILYIFYGLRIDGKENLQQLGDESAVTVCNHVSRLDSAMTWVALRSRSMLFTSDVANFHIPVAGKILKAINVLPVSSGYRATRQLMSLVTETLNTGRLVHFYPEGILINKRNHLEEFKDGAFYAAAKADKPVLPIVIRKVSPAKAIRLLITGRDRYLLMIGEPIKPNNTLPFKRRVEDLKERAYRDMAQMWEKDLAVSKYFFFYDFARVAATLSLLHRLYLLL